MLAKTEVTTHCIYSDDTNAHEIARNRHNLGLALGLEAEARSHHRR